MNYYEKEMVGADMRVCGSRNGGFERILRLCQRGRSRKKLEIRGCLRSRTRNKMLQKVKISNDGMGIVCYNIGRLEVAG